MSLLTVELPSGIAPEEARLVLAIKLYELERLSMGQAAEFAGISKRTFIESLGRYGVALFHYPEGDLERESSL